MKFRILPVLLLMQFVLCQKEAIAEELPEILQVVLKTDTAYQWISCKIVVVLDVPGLNMPEKEIELRLEKGNKPKIKSKGITIIPKHGIIGQYREFLETDCQAILISEIEDTIIYKVVSLDKKTDWITVDVTITQSEAKIQSMLISTRKNGEYLVSHFYGPQFEYFPEKTEISFEAMPLKLPLKFMGKQEGIEWLSKDTGPLTGKVILQYSEISWNKIPE